MYLQIVGTLMERTLLPSLCQRRSATSTAHSCPEAPDWTYYYGEAVNKYLMEDHLSVLSFVNAVSNLKEEQVAGIAVEMTNSLGSDRFNIWGMTPESVYPKIKECWDGIYNNMTANYCKDPSEWPMLFGITTQMIILKAIEAGAGAEEAGLMAIQCAYVISKMDDDSL